MDLAGKTLLPSFSSFTVAPMAIKEIKVVETIKEGKTICAAR